MNYGNNYLCMLLKLTAALRCVVVDDCKDYFTLQTIIGSEDSTKLTLVVCGAGLETPY